MTPILVLTAKSMLDDKIEGLDSGADDYLTKPFQMAELLARIRALTRRSKSIPSLEIGNIKLLEGDYTITALKSIKLTNKEYKLMELLIHNKKIFI
ncbi:MAG: response regulator transcription factor [Clostridium sp.]|nr:MAG: response regulator transcription factor [Clostridium sp.]